ncbi:protein-tyrosine phosphatase-like protein [Phlyctochytrium arcticum]|nr:protein-tyrosine phosphatase-like protein [Phlyctochytrium arcticum]
MSQLASPTSLDIPCSHPFTPSSQLSSAILTPPCEETDANYAEVYPTGPAEILPGVYLGSAFTAQDSHLLSRLGITAILNVAQELDRPQPSSLPLSPICEFTSSPTPREPTQYLHLPLTHSPDSLPPNLSEAITFIHAAKTSSRPVLVHCAQGVARSAAIVIAYVMWFHGSSVQEAYTFVKQRAPGVCPSVGFVGALCEWQAGGRTI